MRTAMILSYFMKKEMHGADSNKSELLLRIPKQFADAT